MIIIVPKAKRYIRVSVVKKANLNRTKVTVWRTIGGSYFMQIGTWQGKGGEGSVSHLVRVNIRQGVG